jgi:TetR/AcrR family transcriptional repressor of nem operon
MSARVADPDSPTKQRLLDAAQALMLAQGFTATTVDEICEKARLTKGSFFHYFDSKDGLGRALLERFCSSSSKMHEQGFCGGGGDPLDRVYTYIDRMIALSQDPSMSKGCLLGCFAQELSDTHPKIRAVCSEAFEAWAKQLGRELAAAKAAHKPRATFDPQDLAEHFIATLEGALILGKARGDMRVVGRALRHYRAYVRSIFEG